MIRDWWKDVQDGLRVETLEIQLGTASTQSQCSLFKALKALKIEMNLQ